VEIGIEIPARLVVGLSVSMLTWMASAQTLGPDIRDIRAKAVQANFSGNHRDFSGFIHKDLWISDAQTPTLYILEPDCPLAIDIVEVRAQDAKPAWQSFGLDPPGYVAIVGKIFSHRFTLNDNVISRYLGAVKRDTGAGATEMYENARAGLATRKLIVTLLFQPAGMSNVEISAYPDCRGAYFISYE